MPLRDRAARLAYFRSRYKAHRKELLEKHRSFYKKHRRKILKGRRTRYLTEDGYAEKNRKKCRLRNRKLKAEVISAYGGKCVCCGEILLEFLTMDHENGGGNKHIQSVGGAGKFYHWLRKKKYPTGFRVLCFNCNSAIGFYGYCPHRGHSAWDHKVELDGRVIHLVILESAA